MSAIPSESGEAPTRGKVIALLGLLALAVGLPFLGLFILRYVATVRQFAALSALNGTIWSWREYAAWLFMSPIVVPALWCLVATNVALLRAPRSLRAIAGVFLLAVVLWAAVLAVRIATI